MSETAVNTGDFGSGSVWKHILNLAIPMLAARAVQMLYSVVDRIYIGHMPDASGMALTGLGLTFPIITLISAFTLLFSMGGSPLFSMARGEGNEKQARLIQSLTAVLLLGSSVILTILFLAGMKPLIFLFGATEESWPYARDYLSLFLLGTPLSMFATGMNTFINAQGYARSGMMTVLSGAIVNIALDPLFIFTFHMGIAGAALASILAQLVSFLWVFFFLWKRTSLRLDFHQNFARPALIGKILKLGTASFIAYASNSVVQAVSNFSISLLDQQLYIGVLTIINSLREILFLPMDAVTSSCQPVISYNYGANKTERIWKAIRFTTISTVCWLLFAWVLIMTRPQIFLSLFTPDGQLIELGAQAVRTYYFGFFMMAFMMTGQSVFVALGFSGRASFFSLLRKIIIQVPLMFILPLTSHLGVTGVLLSEPISNWIGGLASYFCMIWTVRHHLKPADQRL